MRNSIVNITLSLPALQMMTVHRVQMENKHVLKFVMVGDRGVGKSCLVLRFSKDRFNRFASETEGFEFATKALARDNSCMQAQIWDTSGQEILQALTSAYYGGSVGCFIVYDLTDRASFERVGKLIRQLRAHAHKNVLVTLIGNKLDVVDQYPHLRKVGTKEGQAFAAAQRAFFFEVSAKDSTNVREAFYSMIHTVMDFLPKGSDSKRTYHDMTSTTRPTPRGWREVPSRSRPGKISYEHIATGVRVKLPCCDTSGTLDYKGLWSDIEEATVVGTEITGDGLREERYHHRRRTPSGSNSSGCVIA